MRDMASSLDKELRMWRLVNLLVYGALNDEEKVALDQFGAKKRVGNSLGSPSAKPAVNRPKR